MVDRRKYRLRLKRNSLIFKIALVVILLILIWTIFRYAAYFERDDEGKIQVSIQNETNIELVNDIYIDENKIVYLSEDDMKNYFDNEMYYEQINDNQRKYISISNNQVLEITENEYHSFINDTRYKIRGTLLKHNNLYYFPISELERVYNIDVEYLPDKKRVNIERLNEEKVVATINRDTDLKYKMTNLSKNVQQLKQGDKVTIIEKMNSSWVKIKSSDYAVGYIRSFRLVNEQTERERTNKEDYSNFDIKDASLIKITDKTYKKFDEIISNSDSRKVEIKKILKDALSEVAKLKGKDVGVKIDITKVNNNENYYKFLKELKAYLNDMRICLIVVNEPSMDGQILKNVSNIIM